MSKHQNKRKLLMMDLEISYPFVLTARVRIRNLDKLETLIFQVPRNKDLHSFIYNLINPFRHPDTWPVNGDNYHSTFFYKGIEPPLDTYLVSHTMKNGLVFGVANDKKTIAILAPLQPQGSILVQ